MHHPVTPRERRREDRVALDVPVAAILGGSPRRCRLVDLSCSGAQIERIDDTPPPPVHTLELNLGGAYPLRMLVRTVWSDGQRHAVSFLAIDDVDRLSIAEAIDRLLHARPVHLH